MITMRRRNNLCMLFGLETVLFIILLPILDAVTEDDAFALPPSFALGSKPEVSEYDLLDAVLIPFPDAKTQYMDDHGHDGFPALGFRAGSDVKIAHKQILPEELPAEFSILISAKPRNIRGGFIFAVVNPYDTVVELGVRISPEGITSTVLTLYYTDHSQITSDSIANFTVPKFYGKWARFAFRISAENVTLFFNCNETETVPVRRQPLELGFDSASTLYIAQAGPTIGEPYEGALDQVKIFTDPNMAAEQCKTDFPDFQYLDEDSNNEIDVERTDYDGTFREVSGSEDLGAFPPPPPHPDGKGCALCANETCCNLISSSAGDGSAAGRYYGEKGERGPRGPPGESIRGPPGPPGTPGLPGASAPEAVCSCNVTSILATLANTHRETYSPAPQTSVEGNPGPPGEPGTSGERGPSGPRGDKGERGERGPVGPQGIQGIKGQPGLDGMPGQPGTPGPPGPPGPVEFENVDETVIGSSMVRPGVPGPKGEPGKQGPSGSRGDKGQTGAKGPPGEPGMKGDRGDRGLPGEKGPQGPKGETGVPGLDGIPGSTGKAGDKGDRGDSGPPGPPGISVAPGEATGFIPGPPGNRGERGEKGDRGESGTNGEAGMPGTPGTPGSRGDKGDPGVDGAIGPVGPPGSKGERGERGPPGAIIMPEGNEHIVTVKGEKGDMGKRGRRGKPGPMGPPGPSGKLGEIGLPGWMGRPGIPGVPGAKGERGDPGGPKGDTGTAGPPGPAGAPGKDGPPGPPGPSTSSDETVRYVPVPGPPGPPGPPGSPGLSITGPKGEPGAAISYGEAIHYNLRPGRATTAPPVLPVRSLAEDTSAARIVPGALTFQHRDEMTKMSNASPVGTIAYLIEEEALVVRVNSGWQYIALGSLLQVTTPAPPITGRPLLRPPFEASNLINHLVKPADVSHLRLAALNAAYTGDIRGVRGADYACYREARRAGLRGTFRAFLSSRVQNVDSIVRQADRKLPVANLRGEILFNSWAEMFRGDSAPFLHVPSIYSFSGKNVLDDRTWPVKAVWHGAHVNGERALDTSCDSWHSSASNKMGLGANLQGSGLLEQTRYSCDKELVLLCVEATSEIFVQRRRRDIREEDKLLSEEEYFHLIETIH